MNESLKQKIETPDLPADRSLTPDIRDFWSRNVNAERLNGKQVTNSERGSADYFAEIANQRYRSHRHLLPWIRSMRPGRSVLEVGCGIGLDTHTMAQHGLAVTAVDLTEVAIQTIRARFASDGLEGRFEVADACELPFPDGSFDYVYSFGVLHHVADTQAAIDEAFRVLKPGGEALVMLYHRRSLNEIVHRLTQIPFEEKREVCPVVRRYSRTEALAMFSRFEQAACHLDYVYGEGYGKVFKLTPRWLHQLMSRWVGWHIMIRARK